MTLTWGYILEFEKLQSSDEDFKEKKIKTCFLLPSLLPFQVLLLGNACVRLSIQTMLWTFAAVHLERRITGAPRQYGPLQALVHFRVQGLPCAECRSGRAEISCRELRFGGRQPG